MAAINQGRLVDALRALFKEERIKNPTTNHFLELDVWIPELSLSFEFQDTHHYTTAWYSQFPLEDIGEQDRIKKEIAHNRGITIIQVPCWWNGSSNSLCDSIVFQRPDLAFIFGVTLAHSKIPISLNPPWNYFFPGTIPEVGELMLASTSPSLPSLPSLSSPSSLSSLSSLPSPIESASPFWWMGEKYDGIRFCWNSARNSLYGRGCFPDTQKFIYSPVDSINWASLRAICFDNAAPYMNSLPFEKRYEVILNNIDSDNPILITAGRVKWDTRQDVEGTLRAILSDAGEGLVFRCPNSLYEHGRSTSLLKLKGSRGDKEALVVNVKDDVVQLQLPDGLVFEVKEDNGHNLHRGDVVTFSYTNYTSSFAPFRPKITRVRYDYAWDEILNDFQKPSHHDKTLHQHNQPEKNDIAMRDILEDFANNIGIDPLVPDDWYKIKDTQFSSDTMEPIVGTYGDHRQALLQLFPEIGLEPIGFVSLDFGNWNDATHRRKYFQAFAEYYDFDPLISEKWYEITPSQLRVVKNSYNVCKHYDGDFVSALMDLYPELGLTKAKFTHFNNYNYLEEFDMKDFMENFAWENNFDPKIAGNWYSKGFKFVRAKNAKYVLNNFNGSYVNAVMRIFPNIGLVKSKFNEEFWSVPANQRSFLESIATNLGYNPRVKDIWYSIRLIETILTHEKTPLVIHNYDRNIYRAITTLFADLDIDSTKFVSKDHFQEWSNRKAFFDEFAAEHNFDSTVPQNWYTVSRSEFLLKQNALEALRPYHGSYASALMDLYPDIGLKKGRLLVTINSYWADIKNRREFFDTFAKSHSFDPLLPANWYKITSQAIKSVTNGKSVLVYGGGSLRKLLAEAYPEIELRNSG